MKQKELIDHIAKHACVTKTGAASALDALAAAVHETVGNGGEVMLPGIGKFTRTFRAGRTGRNPQTGEVIKIPEKRVVKFKAAKALKDAVED